MKNLLKFFSLVSVLLLFFSACGEGKIDGDGDGELLITDGKVSAESLADKTWDTASSDTIKKGTDDYVVYTSNGSNLQAHYSPVRDKNWDGKLTEDGTITLGKEIQRDGYFELQMKISDQKKWIAAGEKSIGLYEATGAITSGSYIKVFIVTTSTPKENQWFTVKFPLTGNTSFDSNPEGITKLGFVSVYLVGVQSGFEMSLRDLKFTIPE